MTWINVSYKINFQKKKIQKSRHKEGERNKKHSDIKEKNLMEKLTKRRFNTLFSPSYI